MTRISSLFFATTLAILPISAFAQQDSAAAKNAAPSSVISAAPAATADKVVAGKTTTAAVPANTAVNVTQAAKPDVTAPDIKTQTGKTQVGKTSTPVHKTELHSMNTVKSHNGKTTVPASGKIAEPAKS